MQGAVYDIGSKFARGGISVAAVTVICFGLTTDSMEAERAELIAEMLLQRSVICSVSSILGQM